MKSSTSRSRIAAAVIATFGLVAGNAMADSTLTTAAPWSAATNLDFRIVIPSVLYFRVGNAASITELTFSPTTANVGTGALISPTGGDAALGTGVNVEIRANRGQVTITATNNVASGLTTGVPADGFINLNTIATSSDNADLGAPALTNAGGTTSTPTLSSNKTTQRTAVWTYTYSNASLPSAGSYTGRVTYTAATL